MDTVIRPLYYDYDSKKENIIFTCDSLDAEGSGWRAWIWALGHGWVVSDGGRVTGSHAGAYFWAKELAMPAVLGFPIGGHL